MENKKGLTKEIWELDSNKMYVIDDFGNIFEDDYDYSKYIENDYEGIEDGLENWISEMCEKTSLEFGSTLIKKEIDTLKDNIEFYKERLKQC